MKKLSLLFVLCGLQLAYGQEVVTIDSKMQQAILDEHNKERALLGIQNLVWDKDLASYAQEWALHLAEEDNDIYHREMDEFGENISWMSNSEENLARGVSMWNEEKKYFKYKPIGNDWAKSGHYTQVIWKNTKKVGCGCAQGASGATFFVCNYDPHGNFIGQKPY